jgi:hypothetical protein
VIKADEWLALIGMKWLALNWHFTLRIEGGGRENGRGMRCGSQGSGSMAGEAGAARGGDERSAAAALPCFSAEG